MVLDKENDVKKPAPAQEGPELEKMVNDCWQADRLIFSKKWYEILVG